MSIAESTQGWLQAWGDGDGEAIERVMPLIYNDLRRLAAYYLNGEGVERTLQPTALVHEAYMRLGAARGYAWAGRGHLIAVIAKVMRNILVDNARARHAAKRSPVQIDPDGDAARSPIDLLEINEALTALEREQPRNARIVELRFFGDLGFQEIAEVMDLSLSSVERGWRFARAWLHDHMSRAA